MIGALVLIVAGGLARAAVGSANTQWWSSRGVLYPTWMLLYGLAVWITYSLSHPLLYAPLLAPLPLWVPLGIRWERAKKLALWWSAPAIAFAALYHLFSAEPALWLLLWPVSAFVCGLTFSHLKMFVAARGWSDRIPEFISGAIVIGGAGLVLI